MGRTAIISIVLVLGAQVLALAETHQPGYDEIGDLDFWSDLNRDGYADFNDIAKLTMSWLEQDCGLFKPCDDADVFPRCGNGAVNLQDYSRIAERWRMCTDVTNPDCIHLPLTLKESPTISVGYAFPLSCGSTCAGEMLETLPANPAYGVYLFSGEFRETVVDLQIPGRGFDFVWARTYRSRTGPNTRIGNGWDYSYNIKIEPCGANLIVHSGNERRDLYIAQPDGTWTAAGFFRVLTQNPDLSFTLTFADKSTWTFYPLNGTIYEGKVTTIADRNGNSMLFDYGASGQLITVQDTLARKITLSYDANGFIDAVTDFNDRTVSYEYYDGMDANGCFGDLKSVTSPAVTGTPTGDDFPAGKTTLYTYSTGFADDRLNHNLATITDPNGQIFLQNIYSTDINDPDFDHVLRQVLGDPCDTIDLTYVRQTPDANNNYAVTRAVSNDCVGNVKEHFFDNHNQLVIEREYTGRADPNAPTYLDPDVNPPVGKLRAGDPDYFETRYQYNSEYLCTRIDYPSGNYVTNVYEVDLDPGAPRRSYGNLRERHQFAGALEPVSDQNEIVELFEYDTGLGGCGCGGTNFVTRYIDPNGNETLHDHDPNGNPTRATYVMLASEPNVVEEWQYNEFGQVTTHLLPNDGCSPERWDEYTYYTEFDGEQNGYLKNIIVDANNLALMTSYTYDAVGNLITETDPNGNTTTYVLNQLNQVVVEIAPPPFNYTTKYFYDVSDNLVAVEWPFGGGALTQYSYDVLGQMTRMEQDVGDGNTVITQYEYDENGNLIRVTNGKGNITQTTYDERDLAYQVTRGYGSPNEATSTRHYDKNANLKQLYDGNGNLVYDKEYDGFERVVQVADPCGSTENYTYDAAGNNTSFTDKNGYTTYYEYDGLNRLISLTDPCGSAEDYTYDAIGNDTSFTDKNGNTTSYEYDALNRLVSITDPCGCSESYTYDAVGNRISSTDGNGNTTTYEYDELNRPITVTDPCGFAESYDYDEAGNRTSLTNKNGHTTTYQYDALSRLISLTDPCGFTESYTYDDAGNRISSMDKNANTTNYEYDELDRLISITDPCGLDESYTYDAVGNRISSTDRNGNTTDYEYDPLNRLISVTDPCGFTERYTYDAVGNKTSDTDKKGNTATYEYDALDRLISVTDPCGFTERYTYDAIGNRISLTDKNAHTTTYTYDALDRLIRVTDPCGFSTTYAYDCVGNKISQTDANGNTTAYAYGPLDRLIAKADALGYITTYGYDAVGNVNSMTDANGNITAYTYDPLNRLVTKADALGCVTTYGYDAVGNNTSVKDANEDTTTYVYDELNRLIKITSPMGYETKYRYDGVGNIIEKTDPNGDATAYDYDGLNRRVLVSYPDGNTIAYEYDENGNLTMLTNTGGIGDVTYNSYDGLDRLASVTTDYGGLFTKTIKYSYDGVGNRIAMDADANVTSCEYDALDRLVKITDPLGNATTYEYDEIGRRTKMTRQNGIKTTFSYDKVGNLLNLTNRKSYGELISSYDYTYDSVGNRLTMTDSYTGSSFTTWYQYDNVYRLVDVNTSSGARKRQYVYDCVGNRLIDVNDGVLTLYKYDADNRLLLAGGTSYSYYNNGNLKAKTNSGTTSYQYNYGNKLTNVSLPTGGSVTLQYSAAGRRMSKKGSPTIFFDYTCSYCPVCCQWYCDVTMEFDESGTEVASYTSGPQIDEHISVSMYGTTYYYLTDGLGNVTAIYDQDENLAVSYEYDPFGQSTEYNYGMPQNSYRFTGREYDQETGLYYYNERYYDPEVGRFTSQDPLGVGSPDPSDEGRPQHHYPPIQEGDIDNLYAYVGNNPINRVDPLGLCWCTVRELASAADKSVAPVPCAFGKTGGCGSYVAAHNPYGNVREYSKFGSAACDVTKPVSSGLDIDVKLKTCAADCVEAHEKQHGSDRKNCCDKAREDYQSAVKKGMEPFKGRGLTSNTLAKRKRKVETQAGWIFSHAWGRHVNRSTHWSECRAYKASVKCADELWEKYNCDCLKPDDEQCCRDLKSYMEHAKGLEKHHCKKKASKKKPKCPFGGKK